MILSYQIQAKQIKMIVYHFSNVLICSIEKCMWLEFFSNIKVCFLINKKKKHIGLMKKEWLFKHVKSRTNNKTSHTQSGPVWVPTYTKKWSWVPFKLSKLSGRCIDWTGGPDTRKANFIISSLVRSPLYVNSASPFMLKSKFKNPWVFCKVLKVDWHRGKNVIELTTWWLGNHSLWTQ